MILSLRETLRYLRDFLNMPIPLDLLETLNNHSISKAGLLEYKARNMPNNTRSPFLELWLQISPFWRSRKDAGAFRFLLYFPRFPQVAWGIEHIWMIPFVILSKGFVRIRNIAIRSGK